MPGTKSLDCVVVERFKLKDYVATATDGVNKPAVSETCASSELAEIGRINVIRDGDIWKRIRRLGVLNGERGESVRVSVRLQRQTMRAGGERRAGGVDGLTQGFTPAAAVWDIRTLIIN